MEKIVRKLEYICFWSFEDKKKSRKQRSLARTTDKAYFYKIHAELRDLIITLRWLIMSRKVYFRVRGLCNRVNERATETVLKRIT